MILFMRHDSHPMTPCLKIHVLKMNEKFMNLRLSKLLKDGAEDEILAGGVSFNIVIYHVSCSSAHIFFEC